MPRVPRVIIGTESFTQTELAIVRRYLEARMTETDRLRPGGNGSLNGDTLWCELNQLNSRPTRED